MAAVDEIFDALGDPVRRRIVEVLGQGPLPVGQLADRMPVGRPGVSKHLRVLTSAGVVEHQQVGTRNLYSLAPDGLVVAQQWLVGLWDTALADFAREAELVVARRSPAEPDNAPPDHESTSDH